MEDVNFNVYYVHLSCGLVGYYVKFEAKSKEIVEDYVIENFGNLHDGVYSEAYFREILRRRYPRNTRVVNRDRPIQLIIEETTA